MKKLFLLIIAIVIVHAESNYEKGYLEFSGFKFEEIEKYTKEKNYVEGMKYLNDKTLQQKIKINRADPETQKGEQHIEEVGVPDYEKALESFYESAKNNNPVGAYAGNYIVQNYTNKLAIENLKKFVLFNEVMYSQPKKTCQVYLNMGEIYENGYLRKKDLQKALEIYKLGSNDEKCKKGWASNIIGSKIFKLNGMGIK